MIGLINRIDYDATTGCWNWNGALNSKGYGDTHYQGKHVLAHRLSAILWLGLSLNDSSDKMVCHKCNNPRCFNPKHLYIGTAKTNAIDSLRAGTNFSSRKTHCPKGHPYSSENTYIVNLTVGKKAGTNERHCKICYREHSRNYKARKEMKGVVAISEAIRHRAE